MKTGLNKPRGWNFKEVGFPLEWMAIKMKYDVSSFEPGEKSSLFVGVGKCVGVVVKVEKSGGKGVLSKTQQSPVWGEGGWESIWREEESRGIEAPLARFRASVNDLPKSIDLSGWTINRSMGEKEWI
ncbi:hypothetical protein AVEN_45930-1 [Araneus ventricosus]|uniref:Uncharacterized protein n=1 Tax=Araneus ventricosus TaxID=182803 RepID=A0A4Y2EBS4_ARAVE|nr:hypothetical protein AVEN_45930-1 [Araneus ventricosus]